MVIGWVLYKVFDMVEAEWILVFGLFGFASGITNMIAIDMLFEKIPFIAGSGVIPNRFKEIREVVKDTIMNIFFDEDSLNKYILSKVGEFDASLELEHRLKQILESQDIDDLIDKTIVDFGQRPEGMWINMMGLSHGSLKSLIKPFVIGLGAHVGPMLGSIAESGESLNINRLRIEIDRMMSSRLQELTADRIKELLEVVIRAHLGWLVVWGNVFGALIGVAAKAAGL